MITPTRELAIQLSKICEVLVKDEYLKMQLFIGGTNLADDLNSFRQSGGNIIISTPGRLEDVMSKLGTEISLKELEILVLDEADRLLDMGFERSLTNIISKLPKQRRTGLFSATMNDALNNLVKAGLRNPVKIMIKVLDSQRTPEKYFNFLICSLEISYLLIDSKLKLDCLIQFLAAHKNEKLIVYFSTCFCVDYFYAVII